MAFKKARLEKITVKGKCVRLMPLSESTETFLANFSKSYDASIEKGKRSASLEIIKFGVTPHTPSWDK